MVWSLKEYQKKRINCSFLLEKEDSGMWCTDKDVKCCLENCPPPPTTSTRKKQGYHKHRVNDGVNDLVNDSGKVLSNEQKNIIKLRQEKYSLSSIAKEIGKSKTWVYEQCKKLEGYIKEGLEGYIKERGVNDKPIGCTTHKTKVNDKSKKPQKNYKKNLHNDKISLKIKPVQFLLEKTIKLKYTEYKLIKNQYHHIQIFPCGTLTVLFKKDLTANSVKKLKSLADKRIIKFIKNFKLKGIKFIKQDGSYIQLQRDYAIVGTDIAKKYIREKKKLFFFDKKDGKCRLEIDFSKKRLDMAHLEFPHAKKGYLDARKGELITEDIKDKGKRYWEDVLDNNKDRWDVPTVTKQKTDLLLSDFSESKNLLLGYKEQIKLHLEVEGMQKDNLIKQNEITTKQNELMTKQSKVLNQMSKTLKKMDKKL